MTNNNPSALKHGAFSKILILPGEDAQEFENLRDGLFAEYKPTGTSEEKIMESIAKALWQEDRLSVYQHVQYLRARKLGPGNQNKVIADWQEKAIAGWQEALDKYGYPPSNVPRPEFPEVEKTNEDDLLELGSFITLERLDKELDVENKIHSKIDRLFKRYFQMKAMKPLVGLGENPALTPISGTPVLEITAAEVTVAPELIDDAPTSEVAAVDQLQS